MSSTKEQRREIFSTLRKIKGHANKMGELIEMVEDEIGKANDGVFQTRCMIEALKALTTVMHMKLAEEMNRPGYKSFRKESTDEQ